MSCKHRQLKPLQIKEKKQSSNNKNRKGKNNMGVINAPEFITGLGIVLTISAINQIGK